MSRRTALPVARRTSVTAITTVLAAAATAVAVTASAATASAATVGAAGPASGAAATAEPQPPTVELVWPRTGWGYDAPASVFLRATASSTTSTIASVEFLLNGAPVGTDDEAPYEAVVTVAEDGKHRFSARAYDADGLSATSPEATVVVETPPTITLRGRVEPGVETGCLVMAVDGVVYELHNGDPAVVYPGAWVLITGQLPQYAGSYCQQGRFLRVTAAEPVEPPEALAPPA